MSQGLRIVKQTGVATSIWKEEPDAERSSDGVTNYAYFWEAYFKGVPGTLNGVDSGIGFRVCDIVNDIVLELVESDVFQLGIPLLGLPRDQITSYLLTVADWSQPVRVRFALDPGRSRIDVYVNDIDVPAGSFSLNRMQLPAATATRGEQEIGFLSATGDGGALELYDQENCFQYEYWDLRDGMPQAPWNSSSFLGGSGGAGWPPGPLFLALMPGGYPAPYFPSQPITGSATVTADCLLIDCEPGQNFYFYRPAPLVVGRDWAVEGKMHVIRNKPNSPTGHFMVVDDGTTAFMVAFVENELGRFAVISRDSPGATWAPPQAGTDVDERGNVDNIPSELSVRVDWQQAHVFRFERRVNDGLYLFLDNTKTPTLVVPDSAGFQYPESIFNTPTIAFGQFGIEGAQVCWRFFRCFFGSGYEISSKKRQDDEAIKKDLTGTEGLVIISVTDS